MDSTIWQHWFEATLAIAASLVALVFTGTCTFICFYVVEAKREAKDGLVTLRTEFMDTAHGFTNEVKAISGSVAEIGHQVAAMMERTKHHEKAIDELKPKRGR